MMMSCAIRTRDARPAMLPPRIYLLVASKILAVARRLYNIGLLPPSGLCAALMQNTCRAGGYGPGANAGHGEADERPDGTVDV